VNDPRQEPSRGAVRRVPAGGRSNAQWLEQLRRDGDHGSAWADLRAYLRQGLRHTRACQGLGDHALEDVLHDALVRILGHLDTFRGDSRFTTWAMAVAIRVAFGTLRRQRREQLLGDRDPAELDGSGDAPVSTPGAEWVVERRTVIAALRAAIRERLTDRQRTAVLGELAGIPSDELAQRLEVSRNAFYKLHHDARRKLRQAILEAGFSDDEVRREVAGASDKW
jgi:RNA polymerase sigma-70 factor (ECF subfamily)